MVEVEVFFAKENLRKRVDSFLYRMLVSVALSRRKIDHECILISVRHEAEPKVSVQLIEQCFYM